MSKRRRIAVGLGAGALLIALIAALALPSIAGALLERKLNAALAKRELDASWESLEVDWQGRLKFVNIKVTDPERGLNASIEELKIRPALRTLLSEDPRVTRVWLGKTKAEIALDPWVKRFIDKAPDSDAAKNTNKDAKSLTARLKRSLLEHPPDIEGEQLQIKITYQDKPVLSGALPKLALEEDDGAWKTTLEGQITPEHSKVPALLRKPRQWRFEGELSPKAKLAKVRLSAPTKGEALMALALPEIGQISVDAISADVALGDPEQRHATFHLANVAAQLGDKDAIIAGLSVADMTLDLLRPKPLVQISHLRAEVSPQRLGKLRELKAKLKPPALQLKDSVKNKLKGKTPKPPKDNTKAQLTALGVKLIDQLWRADASIEDASLALRLADQDDEQADRLVTLAQGLYVESQGGEIWARGESTDGQFTGHVAFVPGQLIPRSATLQAKRVNIGKLPGMEQGRTLPSRGIRGRLGGTLDFSASFTAPVELPTHSPIERYTLNIMADWREGLLELHGLADEPLTKINAKGQATIVWEPLLARFSLQDAKLKYGPATGYADVELLDWPLRPKLSAKLGLEEVGCQELLRAMPDAMTGPYRNALLEGSFAPQVKLKYPLDDPWKFEWQWSGLAVDDEKPRWEEKTPPAEREWRCKVKHLRTLTEHRPEIMTASGRRLNTVDVDWLKEPFVKRVTEGVSEEAEIIVGPGVEGYISLASLPIWVGGAAYLTEEILFYTNRGINLALIAKAIRINLERGRFVYGGSTVTQQLVKNLFLTRDKTLARKLQEALIAFRLDEAVSKDRLLELYLNIIEFGQDLYGIGDASQFYFQRPAHQLTPLQAVFLANIKPSPSMGNRFKRKGTTPESGHFPERTETIFKRMLERQMITPQQLEEARPFVLKWDAQGNYIEPKPKAPVIPILGLDEEPTAP